MPQPGLISVIIPAYNAARFIALAIDSVLAQPHRPMEILVIDDGSTDRTAEIADRYGPPVRCLRQANAGPPAARNRGLAEARGELIAFLDADDVFEPDCLRLQCEKLAAHPATDIVVGRRTREDVRTAADGTLAFTLHPDQDEVALSLGATLIRRAAFDRIGRFDETLRHCDDWDWFMRVREAGLAMLLHRALVLRIRLHPANITRERSQGQHHMARMLQRSIQRRRQLFGQARSLSALSAAFEPDRSREDAS